MIRSCKRSGAADATAHTRAVTVDQNLDTSNSPIATGASVTRRGFLGVATVGVVTACGGRSSTARPRPRAVPVAAPRRNVTLVPVTTTADKIQVRFEDYPALQQPRGYLGLLPPGWQQPIYVVRLFEGGYAAVASTCTHQGCTVRPEGWDFLCPCHGSIFRRDGRVIIGPAKSPLTRYPVEVSPDGVLTVDLAGG